MPNPTNRSKESSRDRESNRNPEQSKRSEQSSRSESSSRGEQSSRTGEPSSRKGSGSERESSRGERNLSFRCADLGHQECPWEVSGRSEEELFPKIEQHGREKHNMKSFDNETRERVRGAIRERAA